MQRYKKSLNEGRFGLKTSLIEGNIQQICPSLRDFLLEVVGNVNTSTSKYQISTSKYQMSTSQHLTTSTSHHFTTNFLFFVIYTPGFSPSSDSPLERTFLPVRS